MRPRSSSSSSSSSIEPPIGITIIITIVTRLGFHSVVQGMKSLKNVFAQAAVAMRDDDDDDDDDHDDDDER